VAVPAADAWAAFEADLRECNPKLAKKEQSLSSRVKFHEDGVSFKSIDLSGLGLVALPPSVGKLRVRTQESKGWVDGGTLNLQFNKLRALPDAMASVHVEGQLRLNNNLLSSLSEAFCARIRVGGDLNLRSNRLAAVPKSFGSIHVGGALMMIGNPFPTLEVGQRATIVGVQSRPKLNGQVAVCREFYESKRRWRVQLEGGCGEEVSLKPQSLRATSFPAIFPNVDGIVFPPHPPAVGPGHWLGKKGEGDFTPAAEGFSFGGAGFGFR
jgi:hypothetical protein